MMSENPIVDVQDDEWNLIGQIIADGFADDAVNLWAFAGVAAMLPVYRAMARYLYLPRGFGHRTADGKGGTLWLPPGAKKSYGVMGNLSMARAIVTKGGWQAVVNSLAIDSFLSSKKPHEAHFYLFAIAVSPQLQGKGRGGELMRSGLAQVDQAGMPAYLENSKERNIPFYRNYGFEVIEEVVPAKGCPPMWLMWRPRSA